MEPVSESILRKGKLLVQQFRVELVSRFNNAFDAWIYFDMDGDGSITPKEFVALCRPLKLPQVFSSYLQQPKRCLPVCILVSITIASNT